MHIQGIQPTLEHAEVHTAYLPHPPNPRLAEARRVAEQINRTKVEDPELGYKMYDSLIDSLVENTLAVAKQYEHAPEPSEWSCAQRAVWRFSQLSYERRAEIINDRTLCKNIKAFAVVNAGRWLVPCIFPGCCGAQYASFNDRRFHCVDCNSLAVSGKWIEILWPKNISAIESALLVNRPTIAQNWLPGETTKDIERQDADALAEVA